MRQKQALVVSIFAALIFIHPASTQEARLFPELVPLPIAVQLSSLPDPLTIEQTVEAAIAFSGTSSAPAVSRERILAHLRKFQAESARISDQGKLAEGALEYLHRNILSRYSLLATSVDDAVRTGSYNCVSSAVLYAILARSVGLSVYGVRTADHAFCSVTVDGAPIDVETTNVHGFDPGRKKEFTDSFGAVTGYTYVPPSNYRDRRRIPARELLALILYNRTSEEGKAGRFRESVNPAVTAFAFVPTDEFRTAMDIALSNRATALAMRGDFSLATGFLDAAESSWGSLPSLSRLRYEVTHNWVIGLLEGGRLDDAAALLGDRARRAALGEQDWTDLSIFLVQARAEAAGRSGGFLDAAEIVAAGLLSLGSQPGLLQAYEAYVHNAFARLFNARRFDEAKEVLERGLSVHPASPMLASDMASLTVRR